MLRHDYVRSRNQCATLRIMQRHAHTPVMKLTADSTGNRPIPEVRSTGSVVGRSLLYEFGILNPWSVGDGVDVLLGISSEGGDGLSELAAPPEG